MFLLWMFGGVVGVVLSNGIFGVWLFVECSFAGVVCILSGVSVEENEAAMKYFIFQSLGSIFMFLGFVLIVCAKSVAFSAGFFMVFMGMCAKFGLFPFHFWVPAVSSLCSWGSIFYINWVQKFPILWWLSLYGVPSGLGGFWEVVVWLTVLLGCVSGVGVQCYRTLVGYSSLVHSGWMVVLSVTSNTGMVFYFVVYGFVLLILVSKMSFYGFYSWEDHCKLYSMKSMGPKNLEFIKLSVFLDMASLSGFPPLLGSASKVVGACFLWGESCFLSCIILVLASCVTFVYYYSLMGNFVISPGKVGYKAGWSLSSLFSGSFCSSWSVYPIWQWLCWVLNTYGGMALLVGLGVL